MAGVSRMSTGSAVVVVPGTVVPGTVVPGTVVPGTVVAAIVEDVSPDVGVTSSSA